MILYDKNATDFFNLGLGPITTAIKSTVTEERNGSFYLEATVLIDDIVYPKIQEDNIIKADASKTLKDQRFRIKRVVDKHDGTAEIYAEHVSYLTAELTLKPEVTINGDARVALEQWKANIVEDNPFSVYSDITTDNSTKWRIDKVANPRQALGGVEGSLLDTYGGEYRFDNYRISLLKKRGNPANTVLAYGRNITDFEQERNIENVYTSIYPYAIQTKDEKETMVTIDGYVVDCENIGNYPNRRTKPVDFSSEFESEEVPTKAKLKQLAEQYVKDNEIGIPKVSIKVSFLDLSQSPDYAEFKHLEELSLCDDVKIIYPKLGVNTTSEVIRTVWNVLTDSYDEIEIGEKRMTLSTVINEQTKAIDRVDRHIDIVQVAANGKNKIFRGPTKPTSGMQINDIWYRPVGDGETELYNFDGTVWKLEKVSEGLLGGTLDAENGDVNLINVNVNNLVGNISEFVKTYWNAINSRASIDGNVLKFTHNDGSYTSMEAGGIKRYVNGTGKTYNYLVYTTSFVLSSTTSVRWIQLPNDFKGKAFTVYVAIADSLLTSNNGQSINRIVCTGHPNYSNDVANARIPLIGYKLLTDGNNITVGDVQGLMIAIV